MNESQDKPQTETTPPKQGWRVRWSLRALIVVITLGCLLFALISWHARIGKIHEEVAQRLKGAPWGQTSEKPITGRWHVEWYMETPEVVTTSRPLRSRPGEPVRYQQIKHNEMVRQSPEWVQQTGTELLFHRIKSISALGHYSRDEIEATVRELSRLDHLQRLDISGEAFTAADLSRIAANVDIDKINGYHIKLEFGDRMPGLLNSPIEDLNLSHTRFSGAAIVDLPISLIKLNLERTSVTDESLDQFVRLTNLKQLNLKRTPTSRAAIGALKRKMPWCGIKWSPL
ncbi:hypothetical protein [Blastopirellula marina]|uniref:Leucine-rich repeat domain-containing protein n=1 Tax=Blastopirellula marina TaxID=124 RepID=A0A2S8GK17_9BACT|nr:hypothetical protein [Blastopirellula marina]PQO44788.1 hypothetical protein C5Y93_16960 [Blastopirellula marina]